MSVQGNAPAPAARSAVSAAMPAMPGVATAEAVRAAAATQGQDLTRLGLLAVQLGLLVLVIHQFEIESAAFFQLTVLTFAGFLVHSLLPMQYRLTFFLLLSLTGIGLVLGLTAGAAVVGVGLILIGICHLPVPFWMRVVTLLGAGGVLALMRVDWIQSSLPVVVWPILGAIFMFRLCVYMYDLKHDKGPQSPVRSLSYFFLLPNVCFPLFPVVDYKTFRRTYYNEEASAIYQNGIRWMFRGVVHLILYRLVYYHLAITPAEVSDVPDLVRYLTSNFLLYLRVSGQFHLIVGMLHLFGFNLPPTHHLFYLASSFNDFWRRINIYWKDFMMKLFYYPAYFKLRKLGATTALVLSTLFVFASTWILHSYQWFWLRGSFPLHWQDGVFWGALAMLVVINSLYEAKHGRTRSIGARAWTPGSLAVVSLKTVATFCCICVLWSLWTSESFSEWMSLWSLPGGFGSLDARAVAPVVLVGMLWFGAPKDPARPGAAGARPPAPPSFTRTALLSMLAIFGVYLLGQPAVYSRLGAQGALIESIKSPKLNARDSAQMEAGYYEGLLRVDRFNSQLWEVYMRNPEDVNEWGETSRTFRWTTDFRMKELPPNLDTQLRERSFRTNQWGMRDRDYTRERPETVRRFALLGSSVVMGSGVADGETFETLIENRLNGPSPAPAKYQILNFGVGGYGPLEQMVTLDSQVFEFAPDVVIYVGHYSDITRAVRHLSRAVNRGFEIPYPQLQAIVRKAGADSTMSDDAIRNKLDAVGPELVGATYRHIAAETRRRGATPVFVFIPVLRLDEMGDLGLNAIAAEAGFHVIDLSDVWDGRDRSRLKVSEADYHPNREGHRLLAERMYTALMDLEARASLGLFTPRPEGR